MDKYTLLILFNVPFVIFGVFKAITSYRNGTIKPLGLIVRISFWLTILTGLLFAQEIYEFLLRHQLTDSPPLSIADVVELTGINFCLSQIVRLYSKLEATEKRLTDIHEGIALRLTKTKRG